MYPSEYSSDGGGAAACRVVAAVGVSASALGGKLGGGCLAPTGPAAAPPAAPPPATAPRLAKGAAEEVSAPPTLSREPTYVCENVAGVPDLNEVFRGPGDALGVGGSFASLAGAPPPPPPPPSPEAAG